jgi:hypothetical protein
MLATFIGLVAGQKLVERFTGRQSVPDNYIFYAGVLVAVMAPILLAASYLPPKSLFLSVAIGTLAIVAGNLAAQALFGKKNA